MRRALLVLAALVLKCGAYAGLLPHLAGTAGGVDDPGAQAFCVSPPPGLVGWWRAEGNGLDWAGAHPGRLMRRVGFEPGRVGKAFSLDGSGSYIDAGDLRLTQQFTIAVWIRPSQSSNGLQILAKGGGDTTRSYELGVDPNGVLWGTVDNTDGYFGYTQYRPTTAVLQRDVWQHVVWTYKGDAAAGEKMKLYLDGASLPTTVGTYGPGIVADHGGVPYGDTNSLKIGIYGDGTTGAYQGQIDELSFFDRVLGADEVAGLYAADSAGLCAPPPPKLENGDFEIAEAAGWSPSNNDGSGGYRPAGGNPGGYFILNSSGGGQDPTLSQQLAGLVPGIAYVLSGEYASVYSGYGNPSALSFGIALDDVVLLELPRPARPGSGDGTPSANGWMPFSVVFVASNDSALLSLTGERNGDDSSYAVDNLRIELASTLAPLPEIVSQPLSQTNYLGTSAELSVVALSPFPLNYQWLLNGIALADKTNSNLLLTNLVLESGGNFAVAVISSAGSVTSRVANVSVLNEWHPVSYSMPNGDHPDQGFRDNTYSGTGDPSAALSSLSGGLGQLTDGALGDDFYCGNCADGGGYFPWVGWYTVEPVITFDFGRSREFARVAVLALANRQFSVPVFATAELSSSEDGVTYGAATTYTTSASEQTDGLHWINIPVSARGRYLRLKLHNPGVPGPTLMVSEVRCMPRETTNDCVLLPGGVADSASCDIAHRIALMFSGGSGQYFPQYTVGWTFVLSNAVAIESLGWFDDGGDGLLDSHNVGIFELPSSGTGSLLLSASVAPDDPLIAGFRYTSVAPVILQPGNYLAAGTTGRDLFQAFSSEAITADNIRFGEGRFVYTGNNILTFPTQQSDRGVAYFGPNFIFTESTAVGPLILQQPRSQTNAVGAQSQFSVRTSGTSPFLYQWFKDGVPVTDDARISGGQSNVLTIAETQLEDAGLYSVWISNSAGSVTSVPGMLTVDAQPPAISGLVATPGLNSAVIAWRTDEPASATVAYGLDALYGFTNSQPGALRQNQLILLRNLEPGSTYHYLASSSDVVGNRSESGDLTFSIDPAPDLVVTGIEAAPSAWTAGNQVKVSWTESNGGAGVARGFWHDRVSIVNLSTGDPVVEGDARFDANADPLAPGESRRRELSLTLPVGRSGAGDLRVTAQADSYNSVFEYSANSDPKINNTASMIVRSAMPPTPDLALRFVSAPAVAAPGQIFSVVYAVTNQGDAIAAGPWTDFILLSTNPATDGGRLLASVEVTNGLAASSSMTLTQSVALPIDGDAGSLRIIVRVNAGRSIRELSDDNNAAASAEATTVPLALTLSSSATRVSESDAAFALTVIRNGSRADPLTIDVTTSDFSGLSTPATVVIPAGQPSALFQAQPRRDGVFDGSRIVSVVGKAEAYLAGKIDVTVLDSDSPALSFSVARAVLTEGDGTAVTVSRQVVTAQPLLVSLAAPSALAVPASILIPGSQASATFTVVSLNNTAFEPTNTYTLRGSAPGFLGAAATLVVADDDTPHLVIALSVLTVSEAAGLNALNGTVTRDLPSTRSLLVALTSGDTNVARVPAFVVIPGGETNATFAIAPVDNPDVDGTRTVAIGGFAVSTTGNQPLREATPALLQVTDDDGPALSVTLARQTAEEGVDVAGSVRRNTGDRGALEIRLATSDPAQATVVASVIIPDGSDSASFAVHTVADGVPDGNHPVTLLANATGYASGAASLLVSDSELPDLAVTALQFPTNAVTGQDIPVAFRIENHGVAPATHSFTQRLSLSSDPLAGADVLLAQSAFPAGMPPGQFFEQSFRVRMPSTPGQYWLVAETDVNNEVAELLESNNARVSSVPIIVGRSYSVTVASDLHLAAANTTIPLRGAARYVTNDAPARFEMVNIHIFVRGTKRIFSAFTDDTGRFTFNFVPLPGEAGVYSVGADHPGIAETPAQDQFTLQGMRISPPGGLTLNDGESAAGSVWIDNLADAPLTSLRAEITGNINGPTLTLNLGAAELPGNGRVALGYVLNAPPGVIGHGSFSVRVSSAEGLTADVTIPFAISARQPRLVVTPSALSGGMKRGAQTMLRFAVTNEGGAATGPLGVLLPDFPWMTVGSGPSLPPLAPGEGSVVTLLLSPPPDLPLGDYTGTMALNSTNSGIALPFSLRCLSDGIGALRITSVDEYTYYAEGSPNVANALARLSDAFGGAAVIETNTGPAGDLTLPRLTEGYYDLTVTADKHSTFHAVILVEAGRTNEVTALMSRQSVTYSWTVTPVEIEDRYTITVDTTFETVVPKPVIVVEPSVIDLADMVENERQVNITISNHGLIAAQDAQLTLPTHPRFTFTSLVTDIGLLPPQSALTVPVVIRRASGGVRLQDAEDSGAPCSVPATLKWRLPCGEGELHGEVSIWFLRLLACGAAGAISDTNTRKGEPPPVSDFMDDSRRFPYGPGGFTGTGIPPEIFEGRKGFSCEPCWMKRLQVILDCTVKFTVDFILDKLSLKEWFKCTNGGIECVAKLGLDLTLGRPSELGQGYDCAKAGINCLKVLGRKLGWYSVVKYLECEWKILDACNTRPKASLADLGSPAAAEAQSIPELDILARRVQRLQAYVDSYAYLLGDPIWFQSQDADALDSYLESFLNSIETNSVDGLRISPSEQTRLMSLKLSEPLTSEDARRMIERWNRTIDYWNSGVYLISQVPAGQNTNFLELATWQSLGRQSLKALADSEAEGFTHLFEGIEAAKSELVDRLTSPQGDGVCAKVRLRLDQTAIISRDAFKATLEVDNNTDAPLEEVFFEIHLSQREGTDTTSLFQLRDPALSGVSAVDGSGIIPANSSGSVVTILTPTSLAAPTAPTEHIVSATLRYRQNGLLVTVPLSATPITVLPTPSLTVRYFHERDVFSDDPFTPEIEPAVPYSLAVMVENHGYGIAKNLRITSAQPRIIDNEKGLLVNFEILATEVAGKALTPSLTADLGDIGPNQASIGRWLFRSSLQGLFTDYRATFQHVDGKGDNRLSLIDHVEIHEMIRLVSADRALDDGRPDFLVNDAPDLDHAPDTLWLSSGGTAPVGVVTNALFDGSAANGHLEVAMTGATQGGWTFWNVPDPGEGRFRLIAVRRADGSILPAQNHWLTDRTFIGFAQRPRRENKLHLLDQTDVAGAVSYTLVYETVAAEQDTIAPSARVAALPQLSSPEFAVTWTGADNPGGSGLAFFDVFLSTDHGPFTNWLSRTTLPGAVFRGAPGSRYGFYVRATDQAGNAQPAPPTADTETTVGVTNHPPSIRLEGDLAVDEGSMVRITPIAEDEDASQTILFALLPGAPPGVTIHPQTGEILWFTGEANGPSTNRILIRATDNGVPPLSATGRIDVVVNEVNSAPTLDPIASRRINEGALLAFGAIAHDADLPAQPLTFRLAEGAPFGAKIDAVSGVFSWRPTEFQGGVTNRISIIVTDAGAPSLSATQSFSVIVRDTQGDFILALGSTNVFVGETNALELTLKTGTELDEISFLLSVDASKLTGLSLSPIASEIASATLQPAGEDEFRLRLIAKAGNPFLGSLALARLDFVAASSNSALVRIPLTDAQALRAAGGLLARPDVRDGKVVIIGDDPLLEASLDAHRERTLVLYGRPGRHYSIQSSAHLNNGGDWKAWQETDLSTSWQEVLGPPTSDPVAYYRALRSERSTLRLTARSELGQFVLEWPATEDVCAIFESTSLDTDATWTLSPSLPSRVGDSYQLAIPIAGDVRFYRLRCLSAGKP